MDNFSNELRGGHTNKICDFESRHKLIEPLFKNSDLTLLDLCQQVGVGQ